MLNVPAPFARYPPHASDTALRRVLPSSDYLKYLPSPDQERALGELLRYGGCRTETEHAAASAGVGQTRPSLSADILYCSVDVLRGEPTHRFCDGMVTPLKSLVRAFENLAMDSSALMPGDMYMSTQQIIVPCRIPT